MNKFFTIGAVAGWLLLSMISGKLQPVLSMQTILAVAVGGVIAVIVGAVLSGGKGLPLEESIQNAEPRNRDEYESCHLEAVQSTQISSPEQVADKSNRPPRKVRVCPKCKKHNDPSFFECDSCGASIADTSVSMVADDGYWLCLSCSRQNHDSAQICACNCGRSVEYVDSNMIIIGIKGHKIVLRNIFRPYVAVDDRKVQGQFSFYGNAKYVFYLDDRHEDHVAIYYTRSIPVSDDMKKFTVFHNGEHIHGQAIHVLKERKHKETVISKKELESSTLSLLVSNPIPKFALFVAGYTVYRYGLRVAPYAIAVLFSMSLYLDSRRRLGRASWDWVVGGAVVFLVGLGNLNRHLARSDNISTFAMLGETVGLLAGLYALYRARTKRAAGEYRERLKAHSP